MNNQNYLRAEKFFEIPVMISVLMLIPVLIIEYTQQTLSSVALYLNWGIWIVFLLEYVILFYFADDKLKFVKSHKIELVIVIFSFPIVPEGLQSSGFLRFARLPRLLNALRFFRLAALLGRFGATVKSIFNSKGLRFIVYATIGIVLFFGFLFYISEPDVTSYSDGLWWALVTITTVGYGDITPLTNLGRIIASSLMIMGIGGADSVTIDAHKQMYVPMGAGLVVFKNPASVAAIEHHAEYILRKGSKDLGSHTLEGSRPGMAMLVYASLHIISRPGYEMLINQAIEKAEYFAQLINQHDDFELITRPELCLLTYRYAPKSVQVLLARNDDEANKSLNLLLGKLTKFIQKRQREDGRSFVSRTRIEVSRYGGEKVIVFRVVLANPLTTKEILQDILEQQCELAKESENFLPELLTMAE